MTSRLWNFLPADAVPSHQFRRSWPVSIVKQRSHRLIHPNLGIVKPVHLDKFWWLKNNFRFLALLHLFYIFLFILLNILPSGRGLIVNNINSLCINEVKDFALTFSSFNILYQVIITNSINYFIVLPVQRLFDYFCLSENFHYSIPKYISLNLQ